MTYIAVSLLYENPAGILCLHLDLILILFLILTKIVPDIFNQPDWW
jgi:hypothetical protein